MGIKTSPEPAKTHMEGLEPRRGCSDTFDEVLSRRIKRRTLLRGSVLSPLFCMGPLANLKGQQSSSGLTFSPISGPWRTRSRCRTATHASPWHSGKTP